MTATAAAAGAAGYCWDEEEEDDDAGPPPPAARAVPDVEGIQSKVRGMVEELGRRRECVRQRRIELRRVREEAAGAARQRRFEWQQRLEACEAQHATRVAKHEGMASALRDEVAQLRKRADELAEQEARSEEVSSGKLQAQKSELASQLSKLKEQWAAREAREIAGEIEKRKQAIKQKVVKALEPEVQRLVKKNREEIHEKRAAMEREIEALRARLETENEARLVAVEGVLDREEEAGIATARNESRAEVAACREQGQAELAEVWEAQKRSLDDERRRYEKDRGALEAEHRAALGEVESRERRRAEELARDHERRLADDRDNARRVAERAPPPPPPPPLAHIPTEEEIEGAVAPARKKYEADLRMVMDRLEDDAVRDREALARELEAQRRLLSDQNAEAVAKLKAQEVAAMELYMQTADEQTSLASGVRELEARVAANDDAIIELRAEIENQGAAREARDLSARGARDRLAKEHADRETVLRGSALAATTRFDELRSRGEAETAQFIQAKTEREAAHASERSAIEAKIRVVVARKTARRDGLLANLDAARKTIADLETQLNQRRLEHHLAAK